MSKQDLLVGLDIGSSRIACLIAEREEGGDEPEHNSSPKDAPDRISMNSGNGISSPYASVTRSGFASEENRMRLLGGASVPCRGLKGGVVINIQETAHSIREAVEKAEKEAHRDVSELVVGIRGSHLQSFNNRGAFNIARTDKEITTEDVEGVIANAKAVPLSSDREILHVMPQSFTLDRQRGVPDPVGMEGSLLEVDVHIVTASSAHLNNLSKAVAQAGFEAKETVYGLLAAGDVLVTPEEKDLGALFVDFGGQSVSLAIYSEGSLRYSKELPIGTDFITRDLAVGLRTSLASAERLKIEHAFAHPSFLEGDEDIEFNGVDGRTPGKIKLSAVMGIVLPRVEEILSLIADDVQASSYSDVVGPGGVVLAGGGALMRGMTEAATQILGIPARIAVPHPELVSGDAVWTSPAYSTVVGLLSFSKSFSFPAHSARRIFSSKKPAWLKSVTSVFQELF
jgi:cell division protein FtsA